MFDLHLTYTRYELRELFWFVKLSSKGSDLEKAIQ